MKKLNIYPVIASMILLFIPLITESFDGGVFTLTRIAVTGFSIYLTLYYWQIKKQFLVWVSGFVALLFNPIIRIHLGDSSWSVIICFLLAFFVFVFIVESLLKTDAEGRNDCRILVVITAILLIVATIVCFLENEHYTRRRPSTLSGYK